MDLKQLEYFVHVVDLGGFSRAARVLGVAQPAISRQVRGLEVELRQSLLLRNGRGATPTEAGKRLLEHARGILQQVERARHDIDETKGRVGRKGRGRTAADAGAAPHAADRARVPAASSAGVAVHRRGTLVDDPRHAGRSAAWTSASSTTRRRLRPSRRGCCSRNRSAWSARGGRASEPRNVRLRDLPRFPLLIPSRPHAIRRLVETRLASLGLQPQVAMEIDAVPAILELVAEGHGFAVLSPAGAARRGDGAAPAFPDHRPAAIEERARDRDLGAASRRRRCSRRRSR